ncbi:MAG: saccharopine dehydrogenase, partial [Pseudomonadota bacterium]|nr:saccharopine dehydrogenase [Pseudomonadota bacterium]
EEQKNGFFKISLLGKIKEGKTVTLKVSGDTDPGYGCTAKMLTQSALCLAFDLNHNQKGGGFYTPATAMGGALTERLQQYAGMKFEI